ncbi:MAG: phage portal protein [Dehalococcoidia bacterium]|nr:phage portal protein [Dehalococcoidia bacterium]
MTSTVAGNATIRDTGASSAARGIPGAEAPSIPRAIEGRDLDRLRRYREYLEYYDGRRGAPPTGRRERALSFNYARAIVEKSASYLVSMHRPVVLPEDESPEAAARAREAERALQRVWDDNDLAHLDMETEIDTAVLGDGAFKVVWDDVQRRVVVSAPDVQGLHAWWVGDDVRRLWRVASRYELSADEYEARHQESLRGHLGRRPSTVEVVEAWTADRFELWVQGELREARPNPYGLLPYVIYPNVPRPKQLWGLSDIEPMRESLAELNRALTQLSRILELSGNPIAVLENVEEARDIAVQPGAVWEVPEQARAYLLDLLQGGGVRLHVEYVDLIYRTLHDLAETPRVAFGDSGGDRSGVALQTELDPLLRKIQRKRLIRTAAFRQRDRLALRVLEHHTGARFEGVRTDIAWGPVFSRDPSLLVWGMS